MKKLDRNQIAARVAQDIPNGAYVNLGIGLPTLVANHIPKDREIVLEGSDDGREVMATDELVDERYAYTLAAFDIEKDGIATPNPDYIAGVSPAGLPQYLGQGREQARGFDLSFSARVTPALTLLGTLGYVDARIRRHETASLIGDRLTLVADETASGVVRYAFLSGPLRNLRIGASWTYTGGTLVSAATPTRAREFHSPYQLVNAFVNYSWRLGRLRHSLALNGNNVFDKFYLNPSNRLGRGREGATTYTLSF